MTKEVKSKNVEDLFPLEEKTIKIKKGNKTYSFKIKELTWDRSAEISESVTEYDYEAGEADLDEKALRIKRLMACLVEAPFEITEKNLLKLPESIGLRLTAEIAKWFRVTKKARKK